MINVPLKHISDYQALTTLPLFCFVPALSLYNPFKYEAFVVNIVLNILSVKLYREG